MISSNKTKGFTLVELLIVIVVIAILAAISIVAYNGVTLKARDDQRVSDARNILSAISAYHADKGEWLSATNAKTELEKFSTVKVPNEALNRIVGAAPASATDKDKYGLEACMTGSPSAQTGIKITTWSEANNKANDAIVAGTC